MDEAISRQEVIKKLDEALERITKDVSKESDVYHIVYGTIGITKCMIMTIQSEPHWTSCSERLPNKEGEYLVTDDAGGVKTVEIDTLLHYEDDGKPFWCYSQNPIAWMPKPEPYKGVTT